MRVNIYAEEITDRVELVEKVIDGRTFIGIRFYQYLPVTTSPDGSSVRGPFLHREGDDDSAAVTFWGKRGAQDVFQKALDLLNTYYGDA